MSLKVPAILGSDFQLVIQGSVLLVLAILFLQSGIDKIRDYKGNLGWLKGYFEKSPFRNIVPFLLVTITLLEVLTGLTALAAIAEIVQKQAVLLGRIAAFSATFSLTLLFAGQRIAKDYAGAASMIGYLLFAVFSMCIMLL